VNESTFNLLAFQASWRKPRISHLIGRLARIEVTAGLKQDKEEQFSVHRSKRRWKMDDTYTWGYSSSSRPRQAALVSRGRCSRLWNLAQPKYRAVFQQSRGRGVTVAMTGAQQVPWRPCCPSGLAAMGLLIFLLWFTRWALRCIGHAAQGADYKYIAGALPTAHRTLAAAFGL